MKEEAVPAQAPALAPAPLLAVALVVLGLTGPGDVVAQIRQPDTVFSMEGDWLGGSVNYARARGPGRYRGVEAGIGGAWWNAGDEERWEILHVGAFHRGIPAGWLAWDAGGRVSLFSRSRNAAGGGDLRFFLGGSAGVRVGWTRLKAGPSAMAGVFAGAGGPPRVGLVFVPLTVRVSFGW